MAKPIDPKSNLAKLNAFIGTWTTEGRQLDSVMGPAADILVVERFEWAAGGHALIHRFDGTVGKHEASCVEVFGVDPEDKLLIHSYYDDGMFRTWKLEENDGIWTLLGKETKPQPMDVRCTINVTDKGLTRAVIWEHSQGDNWITFWELTSTRNTTSVDA